MARGVGQQKKHVGLHGYGTGLTGARNMASIGLTRTGSIILLDKLMGLFFTSKGFVYVQDMFWIKPLWLRYVLTVTWIRIIYSTCERSL